VQAGDDCAVGGVEGREQAGSAVPDVVVSAFLGHHRERRLRPSQCLDLGFLVHPQHHRGFRDGLQRKCFRWRLTPERPETYTGRDVSSKPPIRSPTTTAEGPPLHGTPLDPRKAVDGLFASSRTLLQKPVDDKLFQILLCALARSDRLSLLRADLDPRQPFKVA